MMCAFHPEREMRFLALERCSRARDGRILLPLCDACGLDKGLRDGLRRILNNVAKTVDGAAFILDGQVGVWCDGCKTYDGDYLGGHRRAIFPGCPYVQT